MVGITTVWESLKVLERRSQELTGQVVATMREEAAGISGGDGLEGGAGGGDDAGDGPLGLAAQRLLDLGEGQLNRVEIGGVGRQEPHAAASALDQRSGARA